MKKLTPALLKAIIKEEKLKLAKALNESLKAKKNRKNIFQRKLLKEAIRQLINIKKEEVKVGKKYKKLYEQKQRLKHNILKRL
jgi:hypothetical protein|tara:strand:+ start:238 stop:486 length:249 start_codon:yes stop_codon:yes gene_type:complete